MLISRRKEGETILIGDEIEIRIITIRKKKVILGVVAPRDVKVRTERLSAAALANTVAAVNSLNLEALLPGRQAEIERPILLLKKPEDAPPEPIRGERLDHE